MKPNCLAHVTPPVSLSSSSFHVVSGQVCGQAQPRHAAHSLHKIKFSISVKNTFKLGTEPRSEQTAAPPPASAIICNEAICESESWLAVCRKETSDKTSDSVIKGCPITSQAGRRRLELAVYFISTLPNCSFLQHYKMENVILDIFKINLSKVSILSNPINEIQDVPNRSNIDIKKYNA